MRIMKFTLIGIFLLKEGETMDKKDNTRIPMEDWYTGEIISAEKINTYNTNISNIWIELDNLTDTITNNLSIESTQVKYDNGVYFNLKDFLDYINTKVFELNSKDGDIDEEINAIKTSINEIKLRKISASDVSYTKKTYINVKDFLDYLDAQVDNINSNISTIKTNVNTNKTNINENATNIVLNKQAINLVKTTVAQIQEDVATLKSKKIGADEISYTNGIYLNVKDFLDYLDSTVKKNTESINVLTNENTTNKQAIALIKEKITAIEEKEITADEIKYENGEYVNAKDFLDYLGTKIDELSENDTISNETINSIKSRLKALEDKQLTASDIKYTKGIYTNINDYLDYVDIQLGNITDNANSLKERIDSIDVLIENYNTDINELNNKLNDKVDKEEGKGLSENDLTTTRLNQYYLAYQHSQSTHAPYDAEANVQSDWNVTDVNSDAYIKNKPTIPSKVSQLLNDSEYINSSQLDEALANFTLDDYAKLTDIANKFDDAQLNEAETNDTQIAIDFFSGANKITTVYLPASTGGGGGATSSYISTTLEENILVQTNEDFNLLLDFSSPNLGKGTLKVFINDVDSVSTPIPQGESTTVISHTLLTKGTNKMVVYVLDRTGTMSNSLTFYIRYGSTELTSTFDAYSSYDYGSVIRYYFTPTALDTSLALTFYMKIDGVTQEGVSCTSDTRGYFTFPSNLEVGRHYCEAWVQDSNNVKSNILTFNLVIIDDSSLVVASDTSTATVEEGEQLSLDYKVYMKNNSSFIVKTYIDDVLVNTGTCGLEISYYKTSSLTEGIHTIKLEVWDVTETVSDYVTWTITVTPSTYEMKTPITAGAMFIASAKNKSNSNEGKEMWIGTNQDGTEIQATLTNFAFNSESGWMNDSLIISGNSWVEIPIKPLSNNAKYGFTLDIEFSTKPIGVENAEVLNLWNEEDNCGIKITTEELIIQSKSGNRADLYFTEEEIVSAIFVIDRDEKMAKIYLNGVMCEAFALSDYEANGVKYLEDFTVNNNVFLGGYNKNGWSAIRNIRIYEVALATDEIINNFISNKIIKSEQRELVEFQKGNNLPTVTVYCDFSGLGKDDKKPCDIVYNSPDVNKYGESWSLLGKTSQLQYQGTSSMAYPIKNYRLNPRDSKGKKKIKMFKDGQPESRFTLKADFMSSGHWQNTGLARFINDNLYHYNTSDEKSMNPMKWYSINNGGEMSDTRECINGFPCRLILVNDGTTPLLEGQAEPTPGNTKDMGIFNFNNDKSNTNTMGLDNKIFPNCLSFEVASNSDTSAGAFIPYIEEYHVGLPSNLNFRLYLSELDFNDGDEITFTNLTGEVSKLQFYYNNTWKVNYNLANNESKTIVIGSDTGNSVVISFNGYDKKYDINGKILISDESLGANEMTKPKSELAYLQDSFELRYPDADDYGADYGYLGMNVDAYHFRTELFGGARLTSNIPVSFFNTDELILEDSDFDYNLFNIYVDDVIIQTSELPFTIDVSSAQKIKFEPYGSTNWTYLQINGVKYFADNIHDRGDDNLYEPHIKKQFSSDYGLKRVIDWVGSATQEEFVANFEQYFNKQYTLRYYLIVILLAMVDNLG